LQYRFPNLSFVKHLNKIIYEKILSLFFVCALVVSCDQKIEPNVNQVESSIKVENGRLAFSSTKEYLETTQSLFKMDEKSLDEWEKKFNINSLRKLFKAKSTDSQVLISDELNSFENASEFMLATLNTNGEIQVGDTIIWYNKGVKHYVPNKNEDLLIRIKKNPKESTILGEYSIGILGERETNKQARITISANNGSLNAFWQRQFTYYRNGSPYGIRKYVHELYVQTQSMRCFPGGCDTQSTIYLRVKLEYRDSRGNWPAAGEARQVTVNVNSTDAQYFSSGSLIAPYYFGNSSIITSATVNSTQVFGIAQGYGPTYNGYSPQWSVDVSGSIYQYIIGDLSSNAWNNEAYPLW
jgi:hypothetical protein